MTAAPAARLVAEAVPGLPEVTEGTDLAAVIARCAARAGVPVGDDDVLVVASKVVAKAEGRGVPAAGREAAIAAQTVREVAARQLPDGRVTRVVQTRSGPVLAAAGVDASDVPAGTVLLLPADPDASARALRARFAELTGARPAVLVTDTAGRPWRDGVTDFALGAAGLECLQDHRGLPDRAGRILDVTVRAVADEVAALADLVKGKAAGTPVAIVRGLGAHVTRDDGEGAARCVRVGPADWFAYGHVEAVRASLGVAPAEVEAPSIVPGGPVGPRLDRAVRVAAHGQAARGVRLQVSSAGVELTGDGLWTGVVAQRLLSSLWAEGLTGELLVRDGRVTVRTVPEHPA